MIAKKAFLKKVFLFFCYADKNYSSPKQHFFVNLFPQQKLGRRNYIMALLMHNKSGLKGIRKQP